MKLGHTVGINDLAAYAEVMGYRVRHRNERFRTRTNGDPY